MYRVKSLDTSIVSDYRTHTMGVFLERYLEIKLHDFIRDFSGRQIVVRGKYDRSTGISSSEKGGKLFNWKRPTAEISADKQILYINCFPGMDYVHHYASIISTYLAMSSIDWIDVTVETPSAEDCFRALLKTNILALPRCDVVIVGVVEKLTDVTAHQPWQGDGDFCWSVGWIGSKKIALLGCKFSIWGDVAGYLVRLLGQMGVEEVIYTGKVGGLQPYMEPNVTVATGTESLWRGKMVKWDSLLLLPSKPGVSIVSGKHVTLPSILDETTEWARALAPDYYFVDPEIGWMAKAAAEARVNFSYLHIVSDNVVDVRGENLSNEREHVVIKKRADSFSHLARLLKFNFLLRYSIQSRSSVSLLERTGDKKASLFIKKVWGEGVTEAVSSERDMSGSEREESPVAASYKASLTHSSSFRPVVRFFFPAHEKPVLVKDKHITTTSNTK